MYRWEGKLETGREVLAIFKTTAAALPRFTEVLAAGHPYDVPEIIAIRPADVSPGYSDWVLDSGVTQVSKLLTRDNEFQSLQPADR